MTTTFLAVSLGIILTVVIQPGAANSDTVIEEKENSQGTAVDTLLDLFTNCFPPNLVQATMQQYKTTIIDPGHEVVEDTSTGAMIYPDNLDTWKMGSTWNHSTYPWTCHLFCSHWNCYCFARRRGKTTSCFRQICISCDDEDYQLGCSSCPNWSGIPDC